MENKVEIGLCTYFGGKPIIYKDENGASLTIGKFCSIGQNCQIYLGAEHRVDWISTFPFEQKFPGSPKVVGHPKSKGDIIIGNDVWIGDNVMILSGISIGDGAVIGAGSVVSKNIPRYQIWLGNPIMMSTFRNDPKVAWWNWEYQEILNAIGLLTSPNIGALREYARSIGKSNAQ